MENLSTNTEQLIYEYLCYSRFRGIDRNTEQLDIPFKILEKYKISS